MIAAVVCSLLAGWWAIEDLEVRGPSMYPLFNGLGDDPDRLAIVRPEVLCGGPQRFGLAVFDRPERTAESTLPPDLSGDLFIKRVIGLSGEEVLIEEGDVLVGPQGSGELSILRKPLTVLRDMLTTVDRLDPSHPAPWLLPTAGPESVSDAIVLDARRSDGGAEMFYTERIVIDDPERGETWVNDTGLELVVRPLCQATRVVITLMEKGDSFTLELSDVAVGVVGARFLGVESVLQQVEIGTTPLLDPGRDVALSFFNIDNQLLVLVDGQERLRLDYAANSRVFGTWSNAPTIVVASGALRVMDVRVLRDVYYTRIGEFAVSTPYRVPDGEYFMLGDNSPKSRDSRHFGAVPESRFRGRPVFRYAPPARRRWFW